VSISPRLLIKTALNELVVADSCLCYPGLLTLKTCIPILPTKTVLALLPPLVCPDDGGKVQC